MEKPVFWMGDSYDNLISMPDEVQDEFGYAIGAAQLGGKAASAKRMKRNLRDVMEVVDDEDGDTYRAMYTVEFAERVYVLDCFKKRQKRESQRRSVISIGLSRD